MQYIDMVPDMQTAERLNFIVNKEFRDEKSIILLIGVSCSGRIL